MIDASQIYTAKRAQNIMTKENIDEVYNLYSNYENVIEKCQIVNIKDIKDSLVTKNYIQKHSSWSVEREICRLSQRV